MNYIRQGELRRAMQRLIYTILAIRTRAEMERIGHAFMIKMFHEKGTGA